MTGANRSVDTYVEAKDLEEWDDVFLDDDTSMTVLELDKTKKGIVALRLVAGWIEVHTTERVPVRRFL